eukprot:TRINITY_DN22569_c0_g1_i1.p1 TRINITY_DN22569_c0_g1~~TRINITY_DN22569_c0_g1_i1.p1  ORF type:complete len:169 (-),score=43.28 TRINITY_DN22569_c0_g1_i1:588-1094(-)
MGFVAAVKPSRSEEVLSPEEQLAGAQQVEAYFDEKAPKRVHKPPRSEGSSEFSDSVVPDSNPELAKLNSLRRQSDVLLPDHFTVVDADAYEENSYYKDLSSAEGGPHHTIGTGFIAMDAKPEVIAIHEEHPVLYRQHSRSNPATNEWEPAAEEAISPSNKPSRSEVLA